ncbi:hypothetical protein EMCRGX_G022199 [Ephydatia muelleri]
MIVTLYEQNNIHPVLPVHLKLVDLKVKIQNDTVYFFGNYYSTIYVNNNGDLSFGQAFGNAAPTAFPISTYPVVAIYQADVDTRGTGSVWYRTTADSTLRAKASNDIRSLTGTIVSPQWLFIATWDHVGYYSYGTDKTNTFQAVLATDNVRSYAILQYADGLIQWPSSGAQAGCNAGDGITYVNIPGSRTPSILNIATSSNVGVGGQWVFLISQAYIDINECTLGVSGCNQICTNTIGSYICSCNLGYQISSNNRTCQDINECSLGTSGCAQICTNTIGSYVCSCYPGYQISFNNQTCVDIQSSAIGSTSTALAIGVTGAICCVTIMCSFFIVFIGYKWQAKRKVVANLSPSTMTTVDLPGMYMSQCGDGGDITKTHPPIL